MCSLKCVVFLVIIHVALSLNIERDSQKNVDNGKCRSPPRAPKEIESVIDECQDIVQQSILHEALQLVQGQNPKPLRIKRADKSSVHIPSLKDEDRRIAGCLLQCVYKKIGAIDETGWPTLEGLVALFSGGDLQREYFIATIQASSTCLKTTVHKVKGNSLDGGERCDVSYDVFDCIAERLAEYCASV